jgi:hypothetical protein
LTLAELRREILPAFLQPIPTDRTLAALFDRERIPRFKSNPTAILRLGRRTPYAAKGGFLPSSRAGVPVNPAGPFVMLRGLRAVRSSFTADSLEHLTPGFDGWRFAEPGKTRHSISTPMFDEIRPVA